MERYVRDRMEMDTDVKKRTAQVLIGAGGPLSWDLRGIPRCERISKQTTRRSWPMRSTSAECIGNAYMSGSRFRFQRKLVRAWARKSDATTYPDIHIRLVKHTMRQSNSMNSPR